jgi:chemotaxis protein CheC
MMVDLSLPVLDGIRELVNIGIGRSAGSLNSLTGHHVTLHVPEIQISRSNQLKDLITHPEPAFSLINQDYYGSFEGTVLLMFPRRSAESLFFLLTGESERNQENEELWNVTLLEVGNIIINAVMGTITNCIGKKIEFRIPEYRESSLEHIINQELFSGSRMVVLVRALFSVEEEGIDGEILLLLADRSIEVLAESIQETIGNIPE